MGHRDAPEALLEPLAAAIEHHIRDLGVVEFVVGQRGAFDRLAAQAVRQAKNAHPQVILTLLLAYYPPAEATPEGFDTVYYPPELEQMPKRFAIAKSNRLMVDHSDYLIVYAWQPGSNAKKLADYAARRQARGLIQMTVLG
jgi:hypothetical protein